MECLAFILCSALKLGLDQLVNMELKIRQNDLTINEEVNELVRNINKYSKKDRAHIMEYVKKTLDLNVSMLTANNTKENTIVDLRND